MKPKLSSYRPVGGKSSLANLFDFSIKSKRLEKPWEPKLIKPKLCSYRPVRGESTLAHLFVFLMRHGNLKNYTNLRN